MCSTKSTEASIIRARKIRASGETLIVARSGQVGADSEGVSGVTVFEDHKTMAHSAIEKLAYYTHGIDFCEGCREGAPAPVARAEPAKAKAVPVKKTAR